MKSFLKAIAMALALLAAPAMADQHKVPDQEPACSGLSCLFQCIASGVCPPNEWRRSHQEHVDTSQDPCGYRQGFSEAEYSNPCDGGGILPEYEEPEERKPRPKPEIEYE